MTTRQRSSIGLTPPGDAVSRDPLTARRRLRPPHAAAWLTALAALGTLAACGGGGDGGGRTPVDPGPAVQRVRITANRAASLDEVSTVALQAEGQTAAGAAVPGTAISWMALDAAVATVGPDGVVRAVAPGVAHVVASAPVNPRAAADTATITVTAAQVARVVAADTALPAALAVGDTGTVTAALYAAGDPQGLRPLAPTGARALTWTSSDPAVVAVTADGQVTARGVGTATIQAAVGAAGGEQTGAVTVQVLAAPFRVQLVPDPRDPTGATATQLSPAQAQALAQATATAVRRWQRVIARGSGAALDRRTPICDPYAGLAAGRFAVAVRVGASGQGPYTGEARTDCLRTDYQGVAVTVTVDTGILARVAASASYQPILDAVVAHEIGHGLGIGSWRYQTPAPKVDAGLTVFQGGQAAAAWQGLGGAGNAPLQVGPPGPASHWSQAGGLCGELMAPVATTDAKLSAVTLGALQDLGWSVRAERADAFARRSC